MSVYLTYVLLAFVSMLLLRGVLLRYVGEAATAITLLLLALGTNLHFYTIFSPGMAHPVAFFLFSALLYCCERYYRDGINRYVVGIAATMALTLIVRPTNGVAAIIPLGYWLASGGRPSHLLKYCRSHLPLLAVAGVVSMAIVMLQLSYWRYTTGQWLFYSYSGEGFDFRHPHIYNGLLSYRKGWFVYTPLAAFSLLGWLPLAGRHRWLAVLLFIYVGVNIWVVFSWREWNYGGSFGCRPLLESFAFLSLPLAMLVQSVLDRPKWLRTTGGLLAAFLIYLNMLQSYQLKHTTLPWDGTNRDTYWKTFCKWPEK